MTDESKQQNNSNNNAAPLPGDQVWRDLDKEIGFAENGQEFTPDANDDAQAQIEGLLNGSDNTENGTQNTDSTQQQDEASEDIEESQESKEEGQIEDGDEQQSVDYDLEIEVPMPYGMDKMTVGQLKDLAANQHLTAQRMEKQRNEMAEDRAALLNIADAVGGLNPQLQQQVIEYREKTKARESALLIEAIPEWKDTTTQANDVKAIKKVAASYGLSAWECDNCIDNRLWRAFKRLNDLEAQVQEGKKLLNGKKTTGKKPTGKKQNTTPAQRVERMVSEASKSKDRAVKDAAINKLLT